MQYKYIRRRTILIGGALYLCVLINLALIWSLCIVPSGSMEPTIHAHSCVLGYRLPYSVGDPTPARGDVIVFRSPHPGDSRKLLKRVIGLPGDTVEISGGRVSVNGEPLEEPYVYGETESPWTSYTVPAGCVFVMGDNRTRSLDSRFWRDPYVPISSIWARVIL